MTTPIPAIVPVEVLAPTSLKPVAPAAPAEELARRFDALMKASPGAPGDNHPHQSHEVTQAVNRQESLIRDTFDKIDHLQRESSHLSHEDLLAQSLVLSRDLTLANFTISSATAVAQGANKSFQSLLKNQ